MAKGAARVIYWFRTDLRLHDSPALHAALDLDPEAFWPIFTWDPHYVYKRKGGVNRWQYLLDCQNDLSKSITKLNPKLKLFVLREGPQTLLPKLFKAWKVTHLVFEKDTDAYARERDNVVVKLAKDAGVEVVIRYGRTLWDSDEVVAKNGGKPTMTVNQLRAAGHKVGQIPKPLPTPSSLPDPGGMPVDFEQEEPDTNPDLNADSRTSKEEAYANIAGPNRDFATETLEELGFPPATTPHRGGESIALRMLDEIIANTKYTATFQKPKTSPGAFEPQSTTLLSPHLHFGSLSVREFFWRVQETVDKYGSGASSPPESLTGQLYFRDMYFAAQAAIGGAFSKTLGNPHVRFVPWHLPSKPAPDAGGATYDVDSARADRWLRRWAAGATGFPWIDALMRQLRADGWMHHLGRHSVACFLTRGGAYVHWERGAEVFADLLLDHEPASNAGNWQWLSCTAFFSQYYRCYSPVSFGQKWDPTGRLIRRYVPELRDLDAKYIYEPWKAPAAALERARVRIEGDGLGAPRGGTYPAPMFDFAERRRICIASIKKAFEVGLHGDDKEVHDGSWRKLFEAGGGGDGTEMMGDDVGSDGGSDADHHDSVGKAVPAKREAGQRLMDTYVKKQKR